MKGVNFHGLQGDDWRSVNGRCVVEQRQRRRLNSFTKVVVGEEVADAELAARCRRIEAGRRPAAIESQPVNDQRHFGARLRFIRHIQQCRLRPEVDQVDVSAVLAQRRPEAGVQRHVGWAGVGPDQLVNWIQERVQRVVTR